MRTLLVVMVAAACGGTEPTPVRGTERAPCRPDASCADGLVCLSNRCVRPPSEDAPPPAIAPTTALPTGPTTAPPAGICETYVRTLEKFARCPKLPADTARSVQMQVGQLRSMYKQYGTNPSAMQSCQLANDATTQAMIQVGC